jgi:hypothetical protein
VLACEGEPPAGVGVDGYGVRSVPCPDGAAVRLVSLRPAAIALLQATERELSNAYAPFRAKGGGRGRALPASATGLEEGDRAPPAKRRRNVPTGSRIFRSREGACDRGANAFASQQGRDPTRRATAFHPRSCRFAPGSDLERGSTGWTSRGRFPATPNTVEETGVTHWRPAQVRSTTLWLLTASSPLEASGARRLWRSRGRQRGPGVTRSFMRCWRVARRGSARGLLPVLLD